MKCPKCNGIIPDGSKFCNHCGAKIAVANACPKCGATNLPPDSKFCPDCGTRLNSQISLCDGNLIEFNVGDVTFKMVRVEAGTFTMGTTSEIKKLWIFKKSNHRVAITDNYYIGQTQVTQALWKVVMGNNPSKFKGRNRPVEMVNWDDCQKFCRRLYELTGKKFRLPTEIEWEFAARGGNKSNNYEYSGSNNPDEVAWFGSWESHDVATKLPNELGIYDMSGNVFEWCYDYFDAFNSGSQANPIGRNSDFCHVLRGGSWNFYSDRCSSLYRDYGDSNRRYSSRGLRLALSE